ncbi:MAG TPA: hypothetical protein VF120_13540 [Ktedonobacterales bacterium]
MAEDRLTIVTLADFAKRLDVSMEQVVAGFFSLVRTDPTLDDLAIVNLGASPLDIASAEVRVGHSLHPLHRFLLGLSNGGSIPFIDSISVFAAAVPHEREWRIVGPFLSMEEASSRGAIAARMFQPIPPLLLGMSLREQYGDDVADRNDLDRLITLARGFGGQYWCYTRGNPSHIECAFPNSSFWSSGVEADDFAEFLGEQIVSSKRMYPGVIERLRSLLN